MPINLFVDTNVFLSFYAFASDDIDQLRKLEGLIEDQTLKLYVSQQVVDEFARNREVKLAKSIDDFAAKGSSALPRFMNDVKESDAYKKAVNDLNKARNDLVQNARKSADEKTFAVDSLVDSLMQKAKIGAITERMIERARLRRDVGNPPGKSASLGDQINWEYLLEVVDDKVDLHVVSLDGDYQCAFKNGKPHRFLSEEWRNKKDGELFLHKELKPFLNQQFAIIKLQVDREKVEAIDRLILSGSFAMTHLAITQLDPFFDAFTQEDAEKLLRGGIDNDQIRWIGSDNDVCHFYRRLIARFSGQFPAPLEETGARIFQAQIADEISSDVMNDILAKLAG